MASSRPGFTLLEIVLALAILGLVTLVVLAGLQAGSRAWEKGEQGIESQQRLRILGERLTQEIKSAYPYFHPEEDHQRRLAFIGAADRLDFVTTADPYGSSPFPVGIKKMALYVDSGSTSRPGGLVLKESFVAAEDLLEPDGEGVEYVLDPEVVDLRLRYFYYPIDSRARAESEEELEGEWVETWIPEDEQSGGGEEESSAAGEPEDPTAAGSSDEELQRLTRTTLPAAVELTLSLAQADGRRLELPPLTLTLKAAAVAGVEVVR